MTMADRHVDETANPPPTPPPQLEGILAFTFLGLMSYFATSYPHPIMTAKEQNPNETRDIAL